MPLHELEIMFTDPLDIRVFLIQNAVIILKHVKLLFKSFIHIYHIIVRNCIYNLGIIDMLLFTIGLIFLIKLYICGAAI